MITRERHITDTAHWVDGITGEIIDFVDPEDLTGYVPAADLAGERERVRELEGQVTATRRDRDALVRERDEAKKRAAESEFAAYEKRQRWQDRALDAEIASDSLRAKLAESQAENARFHEAFLVERDCVVRDLRARLDRYAELESAARVAVYGVGSAKDLAAVLEDLADTGHAVPEHNECDECDHERCITRRPGLIVAHCDIKLRLPSALTPAPAAEPELCGDASSTLNPGLACPQPKGHAGPCGNGRQMWWPKPAPAAPKPETCGECADAGTNRCEAPGRKGYDKACSKGTRRLPVAVPLGRECMTCASKDTNATDGPCVGCYDHNGYPHWQPLPAAQDVGNG